MRLYNVITVFLSIGSVMHLALAQPRSADNLSGPERIVVKVGDEQLKAKDVESSGATPAQMAGLGHAKLEPVDLGNSSWQSGGGSIAAQYVLTLLLAHQGRVDRLDNAPGYPRQGTPIERADWLAVAEYKRVVDNITPSEVSRYYSAHLSDFAKIEAQIVVIRTRSSDAKGGVLGLTAEETRQRAAAIRKALAAGADTHSITAQFSVPNVVGIKTEVFARGDLPHEQEEQIFGITTGATIELQEPEGATILIHAVRRIQRSVQEVSSKIESRLRQEKFQRFVTHLVSANPIWIDQTYFDGIAAAQMRR